MKRLVKLILKGLLDKLKIKTTNGIDDEKFDDLGYIPKEFKIKKVVATKRAKLKIKRKNHENWN